MRCETKRRVECEFFAPRQFSWRVDGTGFYATGADLTTELVLRVSVLSRNKTSLQIRYKDAVEMPGFF